MMLRTKSEQKAFLDGYETCAALIEKYLSAEGKKQLEGLLSAVRSAVKIEDIEGEFSQVKDMNTTSKSCRNITAEERCYVCGGVRRFGIC